MNDRSNLVNGALSLKASLRVENQETNIKLVSVDPTTEFRSSPIRVPSCLFRYRRVSNIPRNVYTFSITLDHELTVQLYVFRASSPMVSLHENSALLLKKATTFFPSPSSTPLNGMDQPRCAEAENLEVVTHLHFFSQPKNLNVNLSPAVSVHCSAARHRSACEGLPWFKVRSGTCARQSRTEIDTVSESVSVCARARSDRPAARKRPADRRTEEAAQFAWRPLRLSGCRLSARKTLSRSGT